MATIDAREIIDAIIAGKSDYPDEPLAVKIVEYTNAWGNVTWGVVFADEPYPFNRRYETPTEYVRNPRVIWERQE